MHYLYKIRIVPILYATVITFMLLLALLALAGNAQLPMPLRVFSVQSGSMAPAIPTGSVVFVQAREEYNVGDVITFNSPTAVPITHRIEDSFLDEDTGSQLLYRTKGDANDAADADPVRPASIIGRTVWHIPLLGYALGSVQSELGLMLLIVIPATLIIYHEAQTLLAELKKQWANRGTNHGTIHFRTAANLRHPAANGPLPLLRTHEVYRNGKRDRMIYKFPANNQ